MNNFDDEANLALNEAGRDEQSQKVKGEGFFIVDLKQIDSMVELGAMAEDVMAYLVLARGVNRRGELRVSTHGAQSIFNRTGMSYTKAEAAIQWLHEHNFIYKPESEMQLGKGVSKARTVKWVLHSGMDELDVALANALVEGVGNGKNNPPLMRIYTEASIGKHGFIADARLDALMVFLHLYRHHTFADCGGVNPRAGIYREWAAANNVIDEQVTDIPNSNGALYEIEGKNATVFTKFAAEALFYIENVDERHIRFWDAFHTLTSLGFMYEVIQIWSANPNGTDKNARKAEPLYTLYVRDRHARESEPYLQREIHDAAFRTGIMDKSNEFGYPDVSEYTSIGSGRFRYIATKNSSGYPMGIYRLKFRPHTVDTGRGMAAEQSRVKEWAQAINKLN